MSGPLTARIERFFLQRWYSPDVSAWSRLARLLLTPLKCAYQCIVQRKLASRIVSSDETAPIVVVIGNITVGGTGKTPLILALATELLERGLRVGVVSRGYGGQFARNASDVRFVQPGDRAELVGDEPALIVDNMKSAAQYGEAFGLVIGVDRTLAISTLCNTMPVDVVLSDDGMQHYAMARHIELVVIDGIRGFGNRELLPLGPLREPLKRLSLADLALVNGDADEITRRQLEQHGLASVNFVGRNRFVRPINAAAHRMARLVCQSDEGLRTGESLAIEKLLVTLDCLHMVAGIGNPQRYFTGIRSLLGVYNTQCMSIEHAFPDHHRFKASDLHSVIGKASQSWDSTAILVTEKDAVKLHGFADKLPVAIFVAALDIELDRQVVDLVASHVKSNA